MESEALVLAAHGSHRHAAAGEPARALAAALADAGWFPQVVAAFWKEFPSFSDVRQMVAAERVFVVPLFMAEGYFTARVVPRELGLDGPLTERDGTIWHCTPPVGTAPAMSEVITQRALAALAGAADPAETALVVVGHGTVQNRQSELAVREHVARLQAAGTFAEVAPAYLEEAPFVSEVPATLAAPNVVVVPLFVADGLHSDADIPRELGLSRDAAGSWQVPGQVGGKRLWYTSSVGTSPQMAEVVLARVAEARAAAGLPPLRAGQTPRRADWQVRFEQWLANQGGRVAFLDVCLEPGDAGRWRVHRCGDAPGGPAPDLDELRRCDAAGGYRPLPFAGDLRGGWALESASPAVVADCLEALYPGALAAWAAEREGQLPVVGWSETARRQTGLQGLVKRLDEATVADLVRAQCLDTPCRRRIVWPLADGAPPAGGERASLVPCAQPCSLLLSLARQAGAWARGESPDSEDPAWQRFAARRTGR